MAATTGVSTPALSFVSIEEYLRTSYDPDVEYVDGYLKEKPVVFSVHGSIQSLLSAWFDRHEEEWNIRVGVEVRVRVAPNRVRLPDVTVDQVRFWPETLVEAPLLVIEVLSPSDTYSETKRRIGDYLAMGIKTVWVIDPETRKGEICGESPQVGVTRLTVAGSPVYVDLEQIFARLDKYQTGDDAKTTPPAEG
jgi:Uma2 family endonuclease